MAEGNTEDNVHVIQWELANFSLCALKTGEKLECLSSKAGNFYHTRWTMVIYPKGKHSSEFLSCYIRRNGNEQDGPSAINIEFEFSLITFDGLSMFRKKGTDEFKRGSCCGFPQFVTHDSISSFKEYLMQYDILKIRCQLRKLGPKRKQTSIHIFQSKFNVEKLTAHMCIENFRSTTKQKPQILDLKGECSLLSIKVSMNKNECGEANENPDPSESFLHIVMRNKDSRKHLPISCWIYLLNNDKDIAVEKKTEYVFNNTEQNEEWILPRFIDTKDIKDNSISLEFEINICEQEPVSLHTDDLTPLKARVDPNETTMAQDLEKLYGKEFSDVTLRIGTESFPVHKCILAIRSLTFKNLLDNLTSNSEKQELVITDVDKNTMALMLEFIYTDKLKCYETEDLDDETIFLLLSAARKYRISSLQVTCVKFLKKLMSIKTVSKALIDGEKHNDPELKMAALDYILKHHEYVMLTDEWERLMQENEELTNQVIRHVRLQKQQNLDD